MSRVGKNPVELPKGVEVTASGSAVKVKYLTQSNIRPPTFVLFTSSTKTKLHFSYERYLINRLRETFDFFATPIRVLNRNRKR